MIRRHPALPRLRLLTAALCVHLADAQAIGLGDAEVGSFIGRPLHLEVPLHLNPGETVDDNCVHLVPGEAGSGDTSNALLLQLSVVRTPVPHLLVESRRAANEPYAKVRLRIDCGSAALVRDYAVLLDPPPVTRAGSGQDAPSIDLPGGRLSAGIALPAPPGTASIASVTPANPGGGDAPVRGKKHHARSAAQRDATAQSHLRLDQGEYTPRHRHVDGSRLAGSRGVLRLETHAEFPVDATPALNAQRDQLRDLRTLMLAGDDALERVMALQSQVGHLESQLHALQGGPAHAGPAGLPGPAGTAATPVAPIAAPQAAASLPTPPGGTAAPAANGAPAPTPTPRDAPASAPAATATPGGAPAPHAEPKLPRPPSLPQPRLAPQADDDLDWLLPASLGLIAAACMGGLLWWRSRRKRRAEWFDATAEQIIAKASIEAGRRQAEASDDGTGEVVIRKTETLATASDPVRSQKAARAAYLAERFPEIGAGLITLHDGESVVNGARLYVETGDRERAEELLEAAIQERGASDIRPWLALFEVQRLKGNADSYAHLLTQFRTHFASSRYLPEVLAVGRQIDPDRPEFASPDGASPDAYANADGTTWLNPELDFVPQALAQDLHDTLMAELVEDEAPAPVARGATS